MQFPSVTGQNLLHQTFVLPNDFTAEFNIVLLYFTQQQQIQVNSWLEFLQHLKEKHHNLHFYELPTLPNTNAEQRKLLDYWMRQGIQDPKTRASTITVYTNVQEFITNLQLPHTNSIYSLLLDKNGTVLHCEEGGFSVKKSLYLAAQLEAKNMRS